MFFEAKVIATNKIIKVIESWSLTEKPWIDANTNKTYAPTEIVLIRPYTHAEVITMEIKSRLSDLRHRIGHESTFTDGKIEALQSLLEFINKLPIEQEN